MSKQEFYDFLRELDVCRICILRYLNGRCTDYLDVDRSLQEVRGIVLHEQKPNGDSGSNAGDNKRARANICTACLGIFQYDMIEQTVQHVLKETNIDSYECDTIYSSVTLPISLQIRELSIWIALMRKFPDVVNTDKPPNISIKEIFKFLINMRLCKETNRTLEQNQCGIMVHVNFHHDDDKTETERASKLILKNTPDTNKKKRQQPITRNIFEKSYLPDNLDLDACIRQLPVPPSIASTPISMTNCTVTGPTIFVAGRYRKISDHLSQSPWIIAGKRLMEDSVQEIIARTILPYFGVELLDKGSTINFMASGREDCDVRCLGNGRPFVLEIVNAQKVKLPIEIASDMENAIDASGKVSVQHLQMVKRDELVHIKTGEEFKKKMYRALCVLKKPATLETLRKMSLTDGVLISQLTPLRVLHRRPLLARPRQIYSVKPYVDPGNHCCIILDIVTQAGTYVKEFVHGEFGRTVPSICSIIGEEIDIVALDVNGIDLDWPEKINNKDLCRQQKKRILIDSIK